MPKLKDTPPGCITIKVRIPEELKTECSEARNSGLHKNDAESTFIRYLLELGLKTYQNQILPIEKGLMARTPSAKGVLSDVLEKAKREGA
jgi:Arc/MetJ-type ribon-helix-helix transcriptional regulator